MIHILIGTRAQLIKMAPVITEVERRKMPVKLIMTGQHQETMREILNDFGVDSSPIWLHAGQEINGLGQVLPWFYKCLKALTSSNTLLSSGRENVILVHGDTFSTLLGAVAGRMRGLCVAHVESGLRSFRIFHPFPEELTRLAVFRFSKIAFCPDDWSFNNLRKYSLDKINTKGNTLLDALRMALILQKNPPFPMPDGKFGVVSLHRFENIFFRKRFEMILELLDAVADRYQLVFVMHPPTRKNLERFGFLNRLMNNPRFHLFSRMGYFEFVTLLDRCAFVVTDGGSNQEELSYLGKPTLLMRQATERQDGLGRNAVLSNYDVKVVEKFIENLDVTGDSQRSINLPETSPSAMIVDYLQEMKGRTALRKRE
ncbi:MAG: UDP-N-acetylglucosamine 2-epimerase [Burkholderiaceae bacterium]